MNFKELGIIPEIIKAIDKEGYTTPSPIQLNAIPLLLEGHDLLGSAQTGTGKTAAFAIPIIQKIAEKAKYGDRLPITALVLAPTRELAEQIKENFQTYSKYLNLKTGAIYGGVAQRRQEIMIDKGVDILVATPGRLLDLVKQKVVSLANVETFVLDEADTMLDMGFIKDVRHINQLLFNNKQTLMFSATISLDIRNLSNELLTSPRYLEMAPPTLMLDTISHSVIYAEKEEKREVLLDLLTDSSLSSVLVFTKTKHYANKLATFLKSYGIKVDAIHGDKSQNKRQQALNDFKSKKNRLLIATDIAARGIDIQELSHVINFDLPLSPETYVHRIGRTGRAGLTGSAITLCSKGEKVLLKQVLKHTKLEMVEKKLEPVSEDSKFKKLENFVEEAKPKFQEEKRKRNERSDKKGSRSSSAKDKFVKKETPTEEGEEKSFVLRENDKPRGRRDGAKQSNFREGKRRDFDRKREDSRGGYGNKSNRRSNDGDRPNRDEKPRNKIKVKRDPMIQETIKEDNRFAKKNRFSSSRTQRERSSEGSERTDKERAPRERNYKAGGYKERSPRDEAPKKGSFKPKSYGEKSYRGKSSKDNAGEERTFGNKPQGSKRFKDSDRSKNSKNRFFGNKRNKKD